MIAGPIVIETHISNTGESAQRPVKNLARSERLPRRARPTGVHVEVERLFPHWDQKHRVPGLAEIFLRDLQLDRLIRVLEPTEQWRCRLADLKIDRTILEDRKSTRLN